MACGKMAGGEALARSRNEHRCAERRVLGRAVRHGPRQSPRYHTVDRRLRPLRRGLHGDLLRISGDTSELSRGQDARVLEIGLGYGTVGQLLAQAGAVYHGLDIAAGPVEMMRQRLRWEGLEGEARAGSGCRPPVRGRPSTVSSRSAACTTPATPHVGLEVHVCLRPAGRALGHDLQPPLAPAAHAQGASVSLKRRRRRTGRVARAQYDANLAGRRGSAHRLHVQAEASDVRRVRDVPIDVRNFDEPPIGPIGVRVSFP